MKNKRCTHTGFASGEADVQNSWVVFQLNFSNNISFCASISRPNAKPRNRYSLFYFFYSLFSILAIPKTIACQLVGITP
jgi:hypothetical protein